MLAQSFLIEIRSPPDFSHGSPFGNFEPVRNTAFAFPINKDFLLSHIFQELDDLLFFLFYLSRLT